MKKHPLLLAAAIGLLGMVFCSNTTTTGNGGSSETINAKLYINDTVAQVSCRNCSDTKLTLHVFATDYRPYEKSGFSATADERMPIVLPAEGTYNFLIRSNTAQAASFSQNVSVKKGGADSIACVLESICTVSGKLIGADTSTVKERFAVSIYGSPFMCVTGDTGTFLFDNMPTGPFVLSVRPAAKRLLIATASYAFSTESSTDRIHLEVELP